MSNRFLIWLTYDAEQSHASAISWFVAFGLSRHVRRMSRCRSVLELLPIFSMITFH
ncbi:hypothetical protein BN903_14 [Halorubrum sp. AJ67]|nr:hypothetical protein BN903_14 [Halorubrum sp. AJ67]